MSDIIEKIIKTSYIFNNTVLAFYSQVIKASFKSNMAMVWVNICDSKNNMKAKSFY